MDFLFEVLFEFVFTLLLDGATDTAKNEKLPKWLRLFAAALIILLFIGILGAVGVAGVWAILSGTVIGGIVIVLLDLLLIVLAIKKLIEEIKKRKNSL